MKNKSDYVFVDDDPDWDKPIESSGEVRSEVSELVYILWNWNLMRADQTPYKVYGYEFNPATSIQVVVPVPENFVLSRGEVLEIDDREVYSDVILNLQGFLWINNYMAKECLKYYQKEN